MVIKLPEPHVRAWYWYAFAAEVFAACALAIFLPITLERMAREIAFVGPDYTQPCPSSPPSPGDAPLDCRAHILGAWVSTDSFSMYVKSTAVALQALGIISIGTLADSAYWRKRLLLSFAFTGSAAAGLFLVLPGTPSAWLPVAAAGITLVGNVCYAASIVCANAFLPGLAREDPGVVAAKHAAEAADAAAAERFGVEGAVEGDGAAEMEHSARDSVDDESRALLDADGHSAGAGPASRARARYAQLLSTTMSRLSSTGVAIGFFAGWAALLLLLIPVTLGGGSTRSMEVALGLCGVWWGTFSVPAMLGLPGGVAEVAPPHWLHRAWARVGSMVHPKEMRELPNLFTYLLAWVFLSDGFHTTTYTAILYASSHLQMSPSKVIIIGLVMQFAAVFSSIYAPRLQRKLGLSNLALLVRIVLLAQVLPLYACLGLILPFGGLRTEAEMYIAAVWFGTLYGPFNSYARAVYAELVPPGHESTFFSLFSLTDKSASFLGPAIVGLIKDASGNIRLGFLFLATMLALPVPILMRVRMGAGGEEAAAWSERRKEEPGEVAHDEQGLPIE